MRDKLRHLKEKEIIDKFDGYITLFRSNMFT
jgi:hypothetical protein